MKRGSTRAWRCSLSPRRLHRASSMTSTPISAFEDWPAWGSLYGFVSCVAIIVVSKILGKLWLMRPEDYYDS